MERCESDCASAVRAIGGIFESGCVNMLLINRGQIKSRRMQSDCSLVLEKDSPRLFISAGERSGSGCNEERDHSVMFTGDAGEVGA